MVKLVHISDIHIGSNQSRHDEYRTLFKQLHSQITTIPIVVITGDIFHDKTILTPEDINTFRELLTILHDKTIVIIPGNHDVNLNNSQQCDLISPLLYDSKSNNKLIYPNVVYKPYTGVFVISEANITANFIHASLIDPPTPSQLKTLIDETADPILLFHGNVSKEFEHECKYPYATMASAHCTLLGDIHNQQRLEPHMAYAGSLIQQNISEDYRKGYLVWNTVTRTCAIKRLKNPNCMVKIDETANESPFLIKQAIEKYLYPIKPIYTRVHVVKNQTTASDSTVSSHFEGSTNITVATNIGNTKLLFNQMDALEATLNQMQVPSQLHQEIADIHRGFIIENKVAKWTITHLEFKNMFCFGGDHLNKIDFSKHNHTVTGIVANNRYGKSSIFDIITYALFGEPIRADRKSIVNQSSKLSYCKLTFEMCTDSTTSTYTIERHDTPARNRKIEFVKLPNTNLTASTTTLTNKVIIDIIGPKERFLETTLFTNPIITSSNLTATQRRLQLANLFGTINYSQVETNIRKLLKQSQQELAALLKPTTLNAAEELNTQEALHTSLKQQINAAKANINQLTSTQTDLHTRKQTIATALAQQQQQQQRQKLIINIQQKIERTTAILNNFPVDIDDVPATTTVTATTSRAPLDDTATKIAQYNKIQTTHTAFSQEIYQLENLRRQLQSTITPIHIQHDITHINQCLHEVDGLLRKYGIEDADADTLVSTPFSIANHKAIVTNITKHLTSHMNDEARRYLTTKLTYESACHACTHNKTLISTPTTTSQPIATTKAIRQLQQYHTYLKQLSLHTQEQIQQHQKNASTQQQIDDINIKLEELETQQAKYDTVLQKLSTYFASIRKYYTDAHNTLTRAEGELEALTTNDEQPTCTTITSSLQQLQDEIDECQIKLHELQSTHDDLLIQYGQSSHRIQQLKRDIEIQTTYDKVAPNLEHQILIYDTYLKSISKKGIQSKLIELNIPEIQIAMNHILNDLSDFTVEFTLTDDKIEIHVNEKRHKIHIDLASGFQKFIIEYAFRHTLTQKMPLSTDFMMIDEGFGCLDTSNLKHLKQYMNALTGTTAHRFIMIVSHIAELQASLTNPIHIQKTRTGTSQLV